MVNLARRKGQTLQQKGTWVVLNGIYYPHKEMSRLPDDLQISNTKTKVVNNCTAFCIQHSPLSNMPPCKIEINGVIYRSAEESLLGITPKPKKYWTLMIHMQHEHLEK